MAIGNKRRSSQSLSKRPLDLPAGTVHAFAGTSAPEGWAMCDGSEVSRTDYAALFAVIGTTYGVGDGLDTFNLPDMRGQFLRALDDMGTAQGAAGVDTDGTARTVGQTQGDAIRNITGTFRVQNTYTNDPITSGAITSSGESTLRPSPGISATKKDTLDFNAANVVPTASENRPTNMGINYIIKL